MAKRRTALGKMKKTRSKKTPKRLAIKREMLEKLAAKRARDTTKKKKKKK